MIQFFRSTIRQNEIPPSFLTDNSFTAFGVPRNYDLTTNALLLQRSTDSDQETILWDGNNIDLAQYDAWAAGTVSTINGYCQKRPSSEINLVGSVPFLRDGLATDKSVNQFGSSQTFLFGGTLQFSCFKNIPYLACTFLCKSTGTSASPQYILYCSTGTATTRTRIVIYANADPSTGFLIASRRLSADASATNLTSALSGNQWRVLTAIFDYANRDMFLRIDGVEVASNLSAFASAGNLENVDPLRLAIGTGSSSSANNYNGQIAGFTLWNQSVSLSEIEAVENRYMDWAGI